MATPQTPGLADDRTLGWLWQHEPWRIRAACAAPGTPEAKFFPSGAKHAPAEALAICEGCPVRQECYAYAEQTFKTEPDLQGVWGGTLFPNEYRAIKRDERLRLLHPSHDGSG